VRRISQKTENRAIIVILSNDPALQHKELFLAAGARDYLSKPIEFDHLKNAIQL